ncbi:acyl-CoA thioesterase [Lutimaribacter marinistellae]|uniref:Acyl-CoA thioesterase n=1 Tax=Lutimaribacter marinistellae TaxID=1820329 RepID=A0ABV7TGY1_9RHOB
MTLRFLTPLTAAEQQAAGLAAPQPLAIADRVRYSELDPLDHVNNKAYLGWFESLRVAYFDAFLGPYFTTQPGPRPVIRSAEIQYIREMVAAEPYIATARVTSFRQSSFVMEQQLWSGDLRATLRAVMVVLADDGSGKLTLPDSLRHALVERDGARAE